MAKKIMIMGTASNAGKSLMVAGLCRIFQRQGYSVAPYKPQNMALNSFVTENGEEIGKAQAIQADACKIQPKVEMNTILLKPTKAKSIQVIVQGKVVGNMSSSEYNQYKKTLLPIIKSDIEKLEQENDIIIIEGAGSPAEINIENDISNMVTAQLIDSPVIIIADIDKGGVFASIYGTIMLQEGEYKDRIKGYIINKYRGDKAVLESGIKKINQLTNKPCLGIQMHQDFDIEEEDGISEKFKEQPCKAINIACIKLPHMSNYTDLAIFEQMENVAVHYLEKERDFDKKNYDMLVIPGSKNTIHDLKWMKDTGIDKRLTIYADTKVIFGICGGYQMLGKLLTDPYSVEDGGEEKGLGFLKSSTVFGKEKCTKQVQGTINKLEGQFSRLSGLKYEGYEIHSGKTTCEQVIETNGRRVYGTYVHGIFDNVEIAQEIIKKLVSKRPSIKHLNYEITPPQHYKERQFENLANSIEENIDIGKIKKIMGLQEAEKKMKKTELDPTKIEQQSMEIIDSILKNEYGEKLDEQKAPIIKRCIHTSADFSYKDTLYFSENAIENLTKALQNGALIVTDTNMALSGINKAALKKLNTEAICYIADEDVAKEAKERGVTRAIIAVEKAAKLQKDIIFVVGNAPTALIKLCDLIKEGYKPAGIIGVPVGFVNVVESKEMIIQTKTPLIVAKGRKGGSNIAAAIVNALMYEITKK